MTFSSLIRRGITVAIMNHSGVTEGRYHIRKTGLFRHHLHNYNALRNGTSLPSLEQQEQQQQRSLINRGRQRGELIEVGNEESMSNV